MLLPDRRRVDLRVDAPAELLDVIRVPGMTVRTRWIIAGTALIVGGIAAWRLAPLVAPPSTGPAAADVHQQAAAGAWIEARAKAIVMIREKADLAPEGLLEAAISGLSKHGLSREDGHAALTHAADIVYARFVDRDFDRYTALRRESGYAFYPIPRLRNDRFMRRTIEKTAGRALGDSDTSSDELWRAYGPSVLAASPRVTGVDPTPEGSAMVVWKGESSLTRPAGAEPSRLAVHSPIQHAPDDSRLAVWRGSRSGQGWPVWFPPEEVLARLERPGTIFAEVSWVLRTEDGCVQPLSLVLGLDRPTRRWWLMQWYASHLERCTSITPGGL